MKEELYFSVDIETDGPIPGKFSMLSFGAAVFSRTAFLNKTFSANLETLPGAFTDPDTSKWWESQPEAWEACRKDLQDPEKAIISFIDWVDEVCENTYTPIFVAYPSGFDFTFMYWYMINFAGRSPFSFSSLDIKTAASVVLNKKYRQINKTAMKRKFKMSNKHSHIAIEDAIEQGNVLLEIFKLQDRIHLG